MQTWVEFPLTKGKVALVDVADLLIVARYSWHAQNKKGYWYARRVSTIDGLRYRESMHRRIMEPGPGLVVDHINGDGLDNRRANLRLCTHQQNCSNNSILTTSGRSKYRGVRPSFSKWEAVIKVDGRSRRIGSFFSPEDAARAYDAAARDAFGEFATLNFPVAVGRGAR